MHKRGLLGVFALFCLSASAVSAQISAPETITNDPAYQAASDYSEATGGDAFLVYIGGELVYEAYHNGYDAAEPHMLASGTKSFTCALAVAATEDGLLTLDERASDTLTEWADDPVLSAITIRDLLSLTSGLPSVAAYNRAGVADKLALAFSIAPNAAPGESFQYGATNYYLFGEILRRKLDGDVLAYLERRILDPIGLDTWAILQDRAGNPNLAGGGRTTAREWAKFGQLILQNGMWDGQQVLDPALLRECFYGTDANPYYGLTFWLQYAANVGRDTNTADPDPSETPPGFVAGETLPDVILAAGAGNQRLYIIPSEDMVIVRLAQQDRRFSDAELIALIAAV
ncbi:MAG: serine hydrolase domain-containing protein [Chloroflexota bacterium]|nr:serine hydrolase domain-containing protein [Chloroflexota bacterium]